MTPVNWNSTTVYIPNTTTTAQAAKPTATAQGGDAGSEDVADISPAARSEVALTGRIAVNAAQGNINSDQASQLYAQVSSIQSQIVADEQANGGTLSPTDAQAIHQLQVQAGQSIYSDAHNGAAPPSGATIGVAGTREAIEAGRISLNEKAGNLSSTQGQQLDSQLGAIHQQIVSDKQANGGSLSPTDAAAINQQQNALSELIYDTAHSGATPGQPPGGNQSQVGVERGGRSLDGEGAHGEGAVSESTRKRRCWQPATRRAR